MQIIKFLSLSSLFFFFNRAFLFSNTKRCIETHVYSFALWRNAVLVQVLSTRRHDDHVSVVECERTHPTVVANLEHASCAERDGDDGLGLVDAGLVVGVPVNLVLLVVVAVDKHEVEVLAVGEGGHSCAELGNDCGLWVDAGHGVARVTVGGGLLGDHHLISFHDVTEGGRATRVVEPTFARLDEFVSVFFGEVGGVENASGEVCEVTADILRREAFSLHAACLFAFGFFVFHGEMSLTRLRVCINIRTKKNRVSQDLGKFFWSKTRAKKEENKVNFTQS